MILFALVIFGLGFILMNQVVQNYFAPAMNSVINSSSYVNSSELAEYTQYTTRSVDIWSSLPAILFLGLILLGIVIAVANQR